jgi:hypothetical protein
VRLVASIMSEVVGETWAATETGPAPAGERAADH